MFALFSASTSSAARASCTNRAEPLHLGRCDKVEVPQVGNLPLLPQTQLLSSRIAEALWSDWGAEAWLAQQPWRC